ncbi:MAG: DUF2480 family protein [Sphingobacteriales bacterium JAD_PAG50586_3]|nr:MAG: DUF2480 family protein [Sphingobacteriales bacterium JAD_PAG50586_3]
MADIPEEFQIKNKVANSGLVELNLEDYYTKGERVLIDIKDQLWQGLILREDEFRAYIKDTDWSQYANKYVAVSCTADAIVPLWAYMLVASAVEPFAKKVFFGNMEALETALYFESLAKLDYDEFKDKRIIVKGCSKYDVPAAAYVEITNRLRPIAKSIMYGEACSTVPVYKAKGVKE